VQRLHESAVAAAKAGDYDKALRLWTEAQKADPGNARYPSNIASMYLKMHRQNDALAAARQALELDPANAHAWVNLGNAYVANGKVADAAASFYLALHFADKPEVYREQFRALASRREGSSDLVAAARMVMEQGSQSRRGAEFNAFDASGVRPAPDIGGFKSLQLTSSQRFDLSKPGMNGDSLYKSAAQSYLDGYMSNREETYYQNAVWFSAKSAFLGHPDAPGLLGIVLAEGYTTIAGKKAAPDFDEARKLSELSVARGGTMGYVGLGDLAFFGKGEPADAHKGIQLYGKAAARSNELAARRLVDVPCIRRTARSSAKQMRPWHTRMCLRVLLRGM
jgi:tetratricopeptide (TPR) repeat protein